METACLEIKEQVKYIKERMEQERISADMLLWKEEPGIFQETEKIWNK